MGAFLGLISDFLIEECFEAYAFAKGGELTSCQSNRLVLAKAVSYNLGPLFRPCRIFKILTRVPEHPGNRFVDIQKRRPGFDAVKSSSTL